MTKPMLGLPSWKQAKRWRLPNATTDLVAAALRDIEQLYQFLADKNPETARRAAKPILEGMDILRDQPGAGRPVEDEEPEFREWFTPFGDSGYVSLYRFGGDTAVILVVRHQRESGC